MAEVITSLAAAIAFNTLDRVGQNPDWAPYAELTATGSATIPIIAAGDTGTLTFTATLPPNFVYRCVEMSAFLRSLNETTIDVGENIMGYEYVEDQVVLKRGFLYNMVIATNQLSSLVAQRFTNPTIAEDWGAPFLPWPSDRISADIYSGENVNVLFRIQYLVPATTVSAITFTAYNRFLVYSVEQDQRSAIWTPAYTIN